MNKKQKRFEDVQKKNCMIKIQDKKLEKPKIKTARIPLPGIGQLVASCLCQKFGYDPTIKGRRKAFIENHLNEIKEIHRLNYTFEKGYSLEDATFFRTWNDYISGRQVPDGKTLYAFAKWLGLDPLKFKQQAIEEMKQLYNSVDFDAWIASDTKHGGHLSTELVNLFDPDISISCNNESDVVKVYCIKNTGKGKEIIEKFDKLLQEQGE